VPELVQHARTVDTVFDLLGRDENDMTAALGWGLTRSGSLRNQVLERLATGTKATEPIVIELQRHESNDGGFTDIEVRAPEVHVIVEAKRGWALPSEDQLRRYEARFATFGAPKQLFVVLTQNGVEELVRRRLGGWMAPAPAELRVIGWSEVADLAARASRTGPLPEREVVRELSQYLMGVAEMRDTNSNSVHVVSLQPTSWAGWPADLTPIDEVVKHRVYHYPTTGGNYPKIVPNYMGFRYWGELQSVHHVDGYEVVDSPFGLIPGAPDMRWDAPAYLLTLGPPFRPDHQVKTGKGIFRAAPVTADLDLLFTCSTIVEARDQTRARRRGG
jgi:hypothetical protein